MIVTKTTVKPKISPKKQKEMLKKLRDEEDRRFIKTMFQVFLALVLTASAAGAGIYVALQETWLVIPFSFALGVLAAGPTFIYSTLLTLRN